MDSYTIQIKPQDELTLVIDKIINSEATRVYLLIPENSRIAQHALNFRLLKREADALGKEIIIVSANPRIQTLALKSAIQVHHETDDFKARTMKTESEDGKPPVMKDIVPPSLSNRFKPKLKEDLADTKHGRSLFSFLKIVSPNAIKDKKNKVRDTMKADSTLKTAQAPTKIVQNLPLRGSKITQGLNFLPKPKVPKLLLPKQEVRKGYKGEYISEGDLKITGLVDKKYQVHDKKLFFKKSSALKILLSLLMFISFSVGAFTLYSILPSAKVYVIPSSQDVELDIFVKALTSISEINLDEYKVPAQIFEKPVELSKTISATGEKEINEKATGKIKVYNSYSSEPQTLVKTTRFISEDGKLFRTTETVIVPGAKVEGGEIIPSFAYIKLEAAEAGADYNISPATFSIPGFKGTPKYLAFYGKSEENMTGGKVARVKIVSSNDYDKSKIEMEAALKDSASNSLAALAPEGFIIPGEAYEIGRPEISSSYQIGDETESFTIIGKVIIKTFAVRQNDVMSLIKKDFEGRFQGMNLLESGDISYNIKSKYFQDGILEMNALLVGKAVAEIDASDLKEKVKGKSETEVRRTLSTYRGVEEARVIFWPFWVSSIPDDITRIEVFVEGDVYL